MQIITQKTPIVLGGLLINNNNALIIKSPVKKIMVVKAFQNTLTETIALNVFDQSSFYKELACDCNDYQKMTIYGIGFILFSYIAIKNSNAEIKIKDLVYYKKSRQYFRMLLFSLMMFLNKDVPYAW